MIRHTRSASSAALSGRTSFCCPRRSPLAFAQLAADGLRVTTAFGNDNRLTYTYGSAAAHVAVAPGTGDVELLDCLVVEDVGRIVNPLTLHGQAIGGMVQGLGGAFLEDLVYDAKGQLLAGNLADYLIPTARRRRSTEKRAQDARASDGAPIGASVTAIVAGCGAADTLGLPLGQVRVLHGSTPFLDGLGLHPVALVVPHVSPLVP
jgi:CO/xanthine dehydrogenase Mo-binding subunit